jgi:hypothetical protein
MEPVYVTMSRRARERDVMLSRIEDQAERVQQEVDALLRQIREDREARGGHDDERG